MRRLIAEVTVQREANGRHSVEDVARRYLEHLEAAGRKPSTIAFVRGHLKHWIEPYLGDRLVDKLRVEEMSGSSC